MFMRGPLVSNGSQKTHQGGDGVNKSKIGMKENNLIERSL